jgi:hypothetical protein
VHLVPNQFHHINQITTLTSRFTSWDGKLPCLPSIKKQHQAAAQGSEEPLYHFDQ